MQLREIIVIKRSGRRMPFDREKLSRSVEVALRKRPIQEDRIERMVSGIVRQLESMGEQEMPSSVIGELVMEALKGLDPVAYVRFASVYRDFREAADFQGVLGEIAEPGRQGTRHGRRRCPSRAPPRPPTESIDVDGWQPRFRERWPGSPLHAGGAAPGPARAGPHGPQPGRRRADRRRGDGRGDRARLDAARRAAACRGRGAGRRREADARGKTMYVTLEPCSHHGRTPPCADAILQAGIARVVCPIEDPDPRVSGKGVALLRQAGVTVDMGVCAEEARWMAAGHILRMTQGRPFVQLKLAVSRDGLIARGNGAPRWVTGPEARALGHLLRARADAILVGRGTVADDDPELTCRLPGLAGASPRRVVLDAHFRTPPTAKLVRTAGDVPVTIVGGTEAAEPRYPPASRSGGRRATRPAARPARRPAAACTRTASPGCWSRAGRPWPARSSTPGWWTKS